MSGHALRYGAVTLHAADPDPPYSPRSLRAVQRAAAAFIAGLGLASLCSWGLDPGVAAEFARNVDSPLTFILKQASLRNESAAQPVSFAQTAPSAPVEKRKERAVPARVASSQTVCVRLCDGYFFPVDNAASCGRLCPGAATEALFQRPGADGIDNAISASGRKYTALANAFHYRTSLDSACSCLGEPKASQPLLALSDPTLRQGDVVMTAEGMKVFQGARRLNGARAFANLAQAAMPREKRAMLLAMERVSAPQPAAAQLLAHRAPTIVRTAPTRHARVASALLQPTAFRTGGTRESWPQQRPVLRIYGLSAAYW